MVESSTKESTIIKLLQRFFQILKEENAFDRSGDQPVVRFLDPSELQNKMSITLDNKPATKKEIETLIRQTIEYSVKTSNPHFHNQLYAGVDGYGLVGAWLAEILNTSQCTYEVAPVFTLMEQEVLKKSLQLVGYLPGTADGIFCPDSSISNMYAMMMARSKKILTGKTEGIHKYQKPLACFTSEDGHYSILKAAHWLGIGTEQVFKVKTDKFGRMKVDDLKHLIDQARRNQYQPFFVNATAGTPVLGAIDPLPEIARFCNNQCIWLHVNACLGGSLLLSDKYERRLRSIEFSNSVAWDPHKMLGVPLQCSIFLTKDKKMLYKMNCVNPCQKDKLYDVSWDTDVKSVQCSRKVDAMKFWLMWKARGKNGLGRLVDQAMSCAEYFLKRITETPGFRLVQSHYECCNICFWYIPPSLRDQSETTTWLEKLSTVTIEIKKRMINEGSLMIAFTSLPHKNLTNFFRMVVNCQPPPTESSMDYVINQIEKFGINL